MMKVTPEMLNTVTAAEIPLGAGVPSELPGRGDVRISLTSRCPLRCSHCHNEGQPAPWLPPAHGNGLTIESVGEILGLAAGFGARSIKFTGGEPGFSPLFPNVLDTLPSWRQQHPRISRWGVSTNGTPFLHPERYRLLADSALDNICIGLDSIEEGELSKPSSKLGVPGQKLLQEFVTPLATAWRNRSIKLNVVFTGHKARVLNVIRAARALGVDVSVIEVNDLNRKPHQVREGFFNLINEVTAEYSLMPRLFVPLNEIYLFDDLGKVPIKFYQDHCRDGDCGNCRKMHLRVSPANEGWQAVPCLLQENFRTIPLTIQGALSLERFQEAIVFNGRGPSWFAGTHYE